MNDLFILARVTCINMSSPFDENVNNDIETEWGDVGREFHHVHDVATKVVASDTNTTDHTTREELFSSPFCRFVPVKLERSSNRKQYFNGFCPSSLGCEEAKETFASESGDLKRKCSSLSDITDESSNLLTSVPPTEKVSQASVFLFSMLQLNP